MYYILIAYAIKLKAELRERERERERKKHPTFMRWTSSTTQYLFYLQKNGSSSHTSFWLFCSFFNTFFYTYIRIVLAALFRAHFFRARIQCVSCTRNCTCTWKNKVDISFCILSDLSSLEIFFYIFLLWFNPWPPPTFNRFCCILFMFQNKLNEEYRFERFQRKRIIFLQCQINSILKNIWHILFFF